MEQARSEVQRFGEHVACLPRYQIPYLRARAVLTEWEQDGVQARGHLEAALRLATTIGLPGEQSSIHMKLATLNTIPGDLLRTEPLR
jgi:hypothetical protein